MEGASAAYNLSSHSSAPSPHDRGGKLQAKLQADRQTERQAHRVMLEKTEKRAAKAAGEHSRSLHGKRATTGSAEAAGDGPPQPPRPESVKQIEMACPCGREMREAKVCPCAGR